MSTDWSIDIYDILGHKVHEMKGYANAGSVSVTWDASRFPSGVYFYRIIAGEYEEMKKLVILK